MRHLCRVQELLYLAGDGLEVVQVALLVPRGQLAKQRAPRVHQVRAALVELRREDEEPLTFIMVEKKDINDILSFNTTFIIVIECYRLQSFKTRIMSYDYLTAVSGGKQLLLPAQVAVHGGGVRADADGLQHAKAAGLHRIHGAQPAPERALQLLLHTITSASHFIDPPTHLERFLRWLGRLPLKPIEFLWHIKACKRCAHSLAWPEG